jgi:hypothetical protein
MKKHALRIFAIGGLFAMLSGVPIYGQLVYGIRANVPFDFTVNKATLPAGEYTVRPSNMQGVISIQSADGRKSAVVITIPVQARTRPDQALLVFHRYGDQYFLAQVWAPGDITGSELPQSRAESELAKNASKPQMASVIGRKE